MLSIFENIRRIIFEIKIKLNVSASPLGDPMVHKVINVTDDAIMFKIFCTIPLNPMAHIMAASNGSHSALASYFLKCNFD